MKKSQMKVKKAMDKFESGKLHSGSKKGPIVTSKPQALAIGISESKKKSKKGCM